MEQLHCAVHIVGAENDVDMSGPTLQFLTVVLGETTADDDLEAGTLLLGRFQMTQGSVELVVGILPDAAGVEHDDICGISIEGGHKTISFEQAGDALGIMLIHLAPEGSDGVGLLGHSGSGYRPDATGPEAE